MLRHQLKTFLTVCDTGSFSKAAAALFLTPSAVLQQVQTLESEFGVSLFERTNKGVSLTAAGTVLERRGRVLTQMDEELRRELRVMVSQGKTINIGTSVMEKVRLLYELWVLFAEEEKDCEIQMVSIDVAHNIPAGTDLIESVNSNVGWMREWEFFEICKVPFGFAVPVGHKLERKESLTVDDLRGETVLTINDGTCDTIVRLLELLKKNGVQVVFSGAKVTDTLWGAAFRQELLLVPTCWHDILINMKVIPFEQDFSLPYGIFYRREPHEAVRRFLEFIHLTYGEGNAHGIVPVLTT